MFWLSYCDLSEVVSKFWPVRYVGRFAMHSRYNLYILYALRIIADFAPTYEAYVSSARAYRDRAATATRYVVCWNKKTCQALESARQSFLIAVVSFDKFGTKPSVPDSDCSS
jgi:hypothetical protein